MSKSPSLSDPVDTIDIKENHLINGVSWHQMMEFASWVGDRLPTEDEWEYVARSEGQNRTYPWGNGDPDGTFADFHNEFGMTTMYCNDYGTSEVSRHMNGNTVQGLCDMSGNIWEWWQDKWHETYENIPSDGREWCTNDCPINTDDTHDNAENETQGVVYVSY